jgi:phosphopantothenoylcysteine synthetase/decarboxylase
MAKGLTGRRILITSGPTWAPIDAVRYIGNRSTGRLGCRIAREALDRGAQVLLIAGPQSLVPEERDGLEIVGIETVEDLTSALQAALTGDEPPDAVVHAMAVLDYVPDSEWGGKTPSGRDRWEVTLVRSPKAIRKIRDWVPDCFLVQFKLESGLTEPELLEAALASLRSNRADMVVANDMTQIRDEHHPALIVDEDGEVLARPSTKSEIAEQLCTILAERLAALAED